MSKGKKLIFFPGKLNVSSDGAEGNSRTVLKENKINPSSGPTYH